MTWSYFIFMRFIQNQLAKGKGEERRKKTMQTMGEVAKQHEGTAAPGVRQVPEGSGEYYEKWRKLVVPQRTSLLSD